MLRKLIQMRFIPPLLIEDIGEMAASTVLAIMHSSHEDTSSAL